MVDTLERPTSDFREASASQAKATLEIDREIAEYLKSNSPGLAGARQRPLRFFMETSQAKEREFADVFAQPEPDETAAPAPIPV